jgi:cell division transport system permease protein
MLTILKRIFLGGVSNLKRNSGLSLATIFIIALTISLVTSLFLIQNLSKFLIANIKEKVDISVYFKSNTLEDDILKAKDEITKIPEVEDVKYISSQETLDKFIEKHQNDSQIMESLKELGDNPFLASLSIKAPETFQYDKIASFLENSSFRSTIEKIDYQERKPIIERIFTTASLVQKFGIGVSIGLAIIAALASFNTIKLAIHNFREEISIMRLVGASNWFIRGPFLIQGIISGFVSVLIIVLIFLPLCYFLGPRLEAFAPGFNLYQIFLSNFWTLFLIQIITGIGIGFFSSLIAIRKYLQV